ncbi:uncharacterized domain 1-containing protein [Meinhardsimonia xiamenensis]|jgi:uncharacterized protein (TIGR00369 family)|uniref:Uncharacterized domain 1-containing protein n=1 Tax=Meinhardsimonia xiamenensis TaxID=990712 RepID=A0A1G9FZY4_9RHOB|nr:PaaI family thioesterase [Meinhardsimonia xiamenensis]PRX32736.1 uncharacterized protein (TIGR00369 family) [Meinhardsimonia xiamenensis]SDK93978.1 uncharacterized domain 1-containing protein [Meinhardsimonia xiamenensis]
MTLAMNADELMEFMAAEFPQVAEQFRIENLTPESLTVRMPVSDRHLRPGGTVSGPSMFALADVAIYLLVLSRIGPKALAVTTNCSIDFMRKPAAGVDLLAEARLLKLGRSLAVGEVHIHSEGVAKYVARASLTYAIPPER